MRVRAFAHARASQVVIIMGTIFDSGKCRTSLRCSKHRSGVRKSGVGLWGRPMLKRFGSGSNSQSSPLPEIG